MILTPNREKWTEEKEQIKIKEVIYLSGGAFA
jgi:hypothetical protein